MQNKQEKAVHTFQSNFNCAQAVFSVFAEDLGLDKDTCLKISTAFGGGMARRQKVCGAVTGGLMALGMKHGKGLEDADEKKTRTYEISEDFMKAFKERNGSIDCRDILGADMRTEKGMEIIQKGNLFKVRCEKCVKDAVELVMEKME